MKTIKILICSLLMLHFSSCDKEKENPTVSFEFENPSKTFKLGETIEVVAKQKNALKIDSLKYSFQKLSATIVNDRISIPLSAVLLGKHTIEIQSFAEGKAIDTYVTELTILNDKAPAVFGYTIIKEYPHNEAHYTQGLEFKGDQLFESAGQFKKSKLLQKELETGNTLKEHTLSETFFAEGLTIVGNKIHQLTWKGDMGFTYNISDFKTLDTFAYNQSKEGWGLCFDGKKTIYKSDGTTKIWKLNAETMQEEGFIQIATNKALKSKFNELEWVDGKIYANTWQKDSIAIINPENGAIEAIINLNGIRKKVGVDAKDRDRVLNGIAYKPKTKQLYITGKYWNKLFEIEVTK